MQPVEIHRSIAVGGAPPPCDSKGCHAALARHRRGRSCEDPVRATDKRRCTSVSPTGCLTHTCRHPSRPGTGLRRGAPPPPGTSPLKGESVDQDRFRSHLRPVILVMAALAVLAALAGVRLGVPQRPQASRNRADAPHRGRPGAH